MLEKIRKFIKEEWKSLLVLVLVVFVVRFELPYVIYTPGGHIDMSTRVSGENTFEADGSLSMTYVSMIRGSLPFLLFAKFIPNWDIVSTENLTYENVDFNETVEIDKIYMREAISNAEYVAYEKADIDFERTSTKNIVTIVSEEAKTKLTYGDEIIAVDGQKYTTLQDFQETISKMKPGDVVHIDYKHKGKDTSEDATLIELDGVTKLGISIATVNEFDTPFNIEVKTKTSESGPSGGLITALEIYNQIVDEDITRGKKIMGTGTIEQDGKVGAIGGVKYKLLGAYKDKADVFICPSENYEEALKVKEENDMSITLLGVDTFDEALKKLAESL